MPQESRYDLKPVVPISSLPQECAEGWAEVVSRLKHALGDGRCVVFECYPGVLPAPLLGALRESFPEATIVDAGDAYKAPPMLRTQFAGMLGDDPVFGRMEPVAIAAYFDADRLAALRASIKEAAGLLFVVGTGAVEVLPAPDLLVHLGVTRWELQRRQRAREIVNLGFANSEDSAARLYKNAYFLDWRVADRVRHEIFARVDFFVDVDLPEMPRMVAGDVLRRAVGFVVSQPFRVVPFFDPGPWGGQWMKEKFCLPEGPSNYAWGFDCVPEENSVTLGFGERRFSLPANVLVEEEPVALLGEAIYRDFGAEFPIRFDLLDTIEGGNLSLQVHPTREYAREHFAMPYTQDESYYILESAGASELYLGLRSGIDRASMESDLRAAQAGGASFEAARYVNVLPTRKHDHFSIPAGTIHCSGSGNLVLEISATPYIFTFKLWDWERLGLDGRPRPIHLDRGFANIDWSRDTAWVERELLDQVAPLGDGPGWREERTGLHGLEFLETRRTWFTAPVEHDTHGTVNVLNLVQGEAIVVESPTKSFAPFEVHYAETFIVPAAVGRYTIRPLGDGEHATVKAYVRDIVSQD